MNKELIKRQYELEKKLAQQILNSRKENRTNAYIKAYNEFFSKISWLPMLNWDENYFLKQYSSLKNYLEVILNKNIKAIEIGCGTGQFLKYLIDNGFVFKELVGIDISKKIISENLSDRYSNLKLKVMDGVTLDLPKESFDVAFSFQLLEHFHPEDIFEHFNNVYKILKKGGKYIFSTPNKLVGPHDISKYFDNVATALHLKEYLYSEMIYILKKVGFKKLKSYIIYPRIFTNSILLRKISLRTVYIKKMIEKYARLIYLPKLKCDRLILKKVRIFYCKVFSLGNIFIIAEK